MKELRFANADGTIDITYLVDLIGTNDDCTVYDVIQKVNNVTTPFGLNAAAYQAGFDDKKQMTTLTVCKAFAVANNYTLTEHTPGASPVTYNTLTALSVTTAALTTKVHGVLQKETAVLVGTIPTVRRQVETATVVGSIRAAVKQKETATIVGTCTQSGNATVTVTSALLTVPEVVSVAILNNDTPAQTAAKIITAFGSNANIAANFTVGGSNALVSLEVKTAAANDATLNIAFTNGTCLGLTPNATSTDTTAGVATGAGFATVIVTAAGMTGTPKTKSVAVADSDTAILVAGKIRTALSQDTDLTALYDIGGAVDGATIVLTAIEAAADDTTLNISIANGTCVGLTTEATSTNTFTGIASGAGNATVTITSALLDEDEVISVALADGDVAAVEVGTKIRADLNLNANVTDNFTVGGTGANVSLEALAPAANDGTLNIAYTNGTCTGLVPDASSNPTTAGAAGTLVNQTVACVGGNTPYVWTTASTLPAGVTFSTAGILYGLPMESGTFPIVLRVTDRFAVTAVSGSINLVIS